MKLTTPQMNDLTICCVRQCLHDWRRILLADPTNTQARIAIPALTETLAFLTARTIQ